ncbi:MAG TPA: hypothetical protein VG013_09625 [Gemmataceae bacterium]|jgi:hypothetical protein|nr:hypothetical protein [Gemmataceae bacterium]
MIDHRFTSAESMPYPGEEHAPKGAGPAESLEHRVHRLEDAVASLQDTRGLEERVTERVAERMSRAAPAAEVQPSAGRRVKPEAVDPVRAEPPPTATPVAVARPPWLLFDVYHELQAMVRMFLDRRYQVSWPARLIPLAALVVMVLSWFTLGSIWVVGPLLDKALDLLLAFVAYKALSREAARYRATLGAGH